MCRLTTTSISGCICDVDNAGLPHTIEVEEKEKSPHRTVSDGSSSKSRCSTDTCDEEFEISRCPVTGRLSNVLDTYIVFPKALGEGESSCVRECIHRDSRQTFACKSIDKSKICRLDYLQREISLLMEMDHKNILGYRMVDIYEDADYVHIITENYTDGELFDKIIEHTTDAGCYSEQKTARIMKSLLDAVAYIHSRDITHRDIKPDNIMFEDYDEESIVLIDFGLSRKHRAYDAPMTKTVGTAYYKAPELLEGRYDKACDVWSVGTIVYIMICGYPPFNGDTDPEIHDCIKRGRFCFPDAQWSAVSAEAKDLIMCMLRRDPRERFTASEALLHPWIANEGKKVATV